MCEAHVALNAAGVRREDALGPLSAHSRVELLAAERDRYREALDAIRSYCPNAPTSHPADAAFDHIVRVCRELHRDETPIGNEASDG